MKESEDLLLSDCSQTYLITVSVQMCIKTGVKTYQWTKALLAYMRSNLWSRRAHASAMAVVLANMQTALWTLARSPPGTTVGGW